MTSIRQAAGSPIEQGTDESIPYTIDVSGWALTPANVSVKVYEESTDVSNTCLRGFSSVVNADITTPYIENLDVGKSYRVEVALTTTADPTSTKLELYFVIICTQ